MTKFTNYATANLTFACPYCRHPVRWDEKGNADRHLPGTLAPPEHDRWRLLQCTVCRGAVMLHFVSVGPPEQGRPEFTLLPGFVPDAPSDTSDRVKTVFTEALLCFSVGAWNAVGTMCRRAIEESLVEKGATGRDLYNKIEDAAQRLSLPKDLLDYAHQVRVIGRDGAHASDFKPANTSGTGTSPSQAVSDGSGKVFIDLGPDDAADAIEFCRVFFDYVYGITARLDKARAKRPR